MSKRQLIAFYSSLITHYSSLLFSSLITSSMRLDLFLKASRLCLRRSVAQELCEAGAVKVNGAAAKSSRTIHAGDEISLRRRNRLLLIRVLALPATRQTSRRDAPDLYEIVSDTALSEEMRDERNTSTA
jgi:ribosomal 50S subunit-recycling heat shock protein